MMVTIALSLIVVSIAAPSFSELVTNERVTSAANSLVADINLARSEAIRRTSTVVLCRSGNPSNTSPVCCETNATGCSDENWGSGWLVYAYGNNDVIQRSFDSALGDDLIKRGERLPDGIEIKTNDIGDNWLIYGYTGAILESSVGLFGVCNNPTTGFNQRLIKVSLTGKANTSTEGNIPCDPT